MIVYQIVNQIDGKRYIGSTINSFNERYGSSKWWNSTHNAYLKRAALKYGPENFKVEILYDTECFEDLVKEEIRLIELYKTYERKYGYNIIKGYSLQNMVGKDRIVDEETKLRQKLSVFAYWDNHPEEKEKRSKTGKERWNDIKYVKMVTENHLAAVQKDDFKQKASKNSKQRWADPKEREKLTEGIRKNSQLVEYQNKISKTSKASWEDPVTRNKRLDSMKKVMETPEYAEIHRQNTNKRFKERPELKQALMELNKKNREDPVIRIKNIAMRQEAFRRKKTKTLFFKKEKLDYWGTYSIFLTWFHSRKLIIDGVMLVEQKLSEISVRTGLSLKEIKTGIQKGIVKGRSVLYEESEPPADCKIPVWYKGE